MELNSTIKSHTANGKPVSRFTMWVKFKPEFTRAGTSGQWTYNPENERKKYASRNHPIYFSSDEECLRYIFEVNQHRFQECKKFDNSKPFHQSCFRHYVNGEQVYPLPKKKL